MSTMTFEKTLVPNPRPAAHGCNACEIPDGRVWLMWYAGTREGVEDQRVLMSVRNADGNWSEPQVLVDHFQHSNDRWVPEIAAPMILENGEHWVVFSAAPLARFRFREERNLFLRDLEYARLFHAKIDPRTWSISSPIELFDREALILQGKNVQLANGSWLVLCNSRDSQGRFSSTLVQGSPHDGWEQVCDLEAEPGCLEPSVAQLPDGRLLCYMRNAGYDGCIWRSESDNSPSDFSTPSQTTLRNPHSGIDIAADEEGRLFIAYNDSHRMRTPLTLGISVDEGRTFRCRDIETSSGEFSYPKLLQTCDGQWQVFYTHRRECIAHVEELFVLALELIEAGIGAELCHLAGDLGQFRAGHQRPPLRQRSAHGYGRTCLGLAMNMEIIHELFRAHEPDSHAAI